MPRRVRPKPEKATAVKHPRAPGRFQPDGPQPRTAPITQERDRAAAERGFTKLGTVDLSKGGDPFAGLPKKDDKT